MGDESAGEGKAISMRFWLAPLLGSQVVNGDAGESLAAWEMVKEM